MTDDKRELNLDEELDTSGLSATDTDGTADLGAEAQGGFTSSNASADDWTGNRGGFGGASGGSSRVETIHAAEIVPEHLDRLPDLDHVEEYVGGEHVYDEETAGALVALMFAKTHQEPEQYVPPKREETVTETAPSEQSSSGSAPQYAEIPRKEKKKKKKKKKGCGCGCVVWLLIIGVIVVGGAWLLPEINWDYFFGDLIDGVIGEEHAVENQSFIYHEDSDGITIDGINYSRENVVIPERIDGKRVIAISPYAFEGNPTVRTISLPSSVHTIRENAFKNCTNLTNIDMGGVVSIGEDAFNGCSSLTNLRLPDTLAIISDRAFSNCYSLGSVTIPGSVWMVGINSFSNCGLIRIQCMMHARPVDWAENWHDYMADVTWSLDFKDSIEWSVIGSGASIDKYKGLSFESINIPETIDGFRVVRIGEGAFEQTRDIVNISLPETVEEIADRAFYNCYSLVNINMPASLKRIGSEVFYGTNLEVVELPRGFETISEKAFYGCYNLNMVYIPDTVTEIGTMAFDTYYTAILCEVDSSPEGWRDGWCGDATVTYGYVPTLKESDLSYYIDGNCATVTGYNGNAARFKIPSELGGYPVMAIGANAFLSRQNITKIVLPDTLSTIGYAAFEGCSSLEEINIPAAVTVIPERAFYKCTSLNEVAIAGNNLMEIGYSAFSDCTSLTEIRLPNSLNTIDSYAFSSCSSLRSINIPGGVRAVQNESFLGCSSLRYVDLGYGVEEIESGAFGDCYELATVSFPPTIATISDSAFSFCYSLREVRLPESAWVATDAFFASDTVVTRAALDDSTGMYFSVNTSESGEIYAVLTDADYYLTELVIPSYYDGVPVREIGSSALHGRSQLTRVVLPETLERIAYGAFSNCSSLTEIVIPAGVTEIGYSAFYYCTNLLSARILGAKYMRDNVFTGCESLYDVTLPDGLLVIENSFVYTPSLKELFIPESVREMWSGAFDSNDHEIKLYTPLGVAPAEWYFTGFPNRIKVYWNYDVPKIHDLSVSFTEDGAVINSVAIPGVFNVPLHVAGVRVVAIGSNMIDNNYSLTEVRIPTTVERINATAFYGSSSLTRVYIPASVIYIDENAFMSASGYVIYCEAAEKPYTWGEYWNNTGCEVVWGHGFATPEDMYYYELKEDIYGDVYASLTGYGGSYSTITVPTHINGYKIREIGNYAFSNNTLIRSVSIPEGIEYIGTYAFVGCSNLERVYFPTTLYRVDNYAFSDCTSLNHIFFTEGLREIGCYTFNNTALTDVYLPDSVEMIESCAFSNCEDLIGISIPASTTYMGSHAFRGSYSVTVYYEGASVPAGWDTTWAKDTYDIYFNYR